MSISSQRVQAEILSFCEDCSRNLEQMASNQTSIDFMRAQLPRLLLNRELCAGLLNGALNGEGYPDIRRPTMFDNEVPLHVHPQGLFSLRMYLWSPGEYTYPHDHNAWGVIGTVSAGFEVINFRRLDDERQEGYAQLDEVERLHLGPGETAFTLPFSRGIHQTGNAGSDSILTLHFYGKSLPRGYLNGFDPARNRVYRVYPPRQKKEQLARQALESLEKGLRGYSTTEQSDQKAVGWVE